MALLFELVTSVVGLALKPLLLAKISCQIGVRSISIVIQTCLELLRYAFSLHFRILWRIAICSTAVLSLPVRAFTALYRERLLEMQLYRLNNEMENVLWDRKELEDQLRIAIKDGKMMEMMLMELEEEHDEAIVKIELLQGELHDLKNETQQLKEIQGKALWGCYWGRGEVGNECNTMATNNIGKSSWKPDHNKSIRQVSKDEAGSRIYGLSQLCVTNMIPNEEGSLALAKQREIALSRSLFSAILSLVVGVVVWKAEDACTPLMMALFTVVTMSLMSVVRLLTKIEHNLAVEAIALLSTNWFILGAIAYPMLPTIARLALAFLQRTLN